LLNVGPGGLNRLNGSGESSLATGIGQGGGKNSTRKSFPWRTICYLSSVGTGTEKQSGMATADKWAWVEHSLPVFQKYFWG
jgi:hypothetical protein